MDTDEATQLVRELMKEWNNIGHVPFKEKKTVCISNTTGQVDKLFDHFNISAANKKLSNFKPTSAVFRKAARSHSIANARNWYVQQMP